MNARALVVACVLGVPAAALLAIGPRGRADVPPGRIVVQYWGGWTGKEGAAFLRLVDRFNATAGAEHGIWLDYNAIGDVDKRMLISAAGGDPPDIAGLPNRFLGVYASRGALQPLDELARDARIDFSALKPIWLRLASCQGRLYGLPSTPFTVALYYNRALFRDAGLDPDQPPRTTAELNEFARRLTRYETQTDARGAVVARRITQLGFTVSPAMLGWWPWVWPYFFGGDLWVDGEARIDAPPVQEAFRWIADYREAADARLVNDFEATAGAIESAQNPFLAGRLAMVFQGPWMSNWAQTYAPGLDYGVAPFPCSAAEERRAFASTDLFVIPAGSRHPREAMVFLAWMLRRENLEELCRDHGKVSPFREPGQEFYRGHPNPHVRVFDALADSPGAFGEPQMPVWAEASDHILSLLNRVLHYRPPSGAPRAAAIAENIAAGVRSAQRQIDAALRRYEQIATRRARRAGVDAVSRARDARRSAAAPGGRTLEGLLWTAPWTLGFLLLLAGPMAFSLYISFCDYPLLQPPVFTGAANYQQLVGDGTFWKTVWNTVIYATFAIPLSAALAIGLAVLLNQRVPGQPFYRACIFLPTVVPLVAAGVVWMWIFNPEYGLMNTALRGVGVDNPPGWLGSPVWGMTALIIVSLWFVGSPVVIYLAGLQEVPEELYEAARIDGASPLRRFWHVTLPGLSPVILFNVIVGVINAWQVFALPFIMWRTQRGPAEATYFYTHYLFDNAFNYLKMGYASAMAWIQLLIILALTALVFLGSRRLVHYRGA